MSSFSTHFNLTHLIESALPRHFSHRRGKLGPARTFLILFSMRVFGQRGYRRVLAELKDGLRTHLDWLRDDPVSPAAMCKSRKKLTRSHCDAAFRCVYEACSLPRQHTDRCYKGMRLVALDGTRLSLPDSPELREQFGTSSNQHGSSGVPIAGLMLMWDASAQQPITFKLEPYKHCERQVALRMFDDLPETSLLITDRGFACYQVFADLVEREQAFLIRVAKTLSKPIRTFLESEADDQILTLNKTKNAQDAGVERETLNLRFLKVFLPNGETEILATNLVDSDEHPREALASLYTRRWSIEVAFREMKMWHALEDFSARHALGIYQEVTAVLCFALLTSELEAKIREEKAERSQDTPPDELPEIRYNRLLIADAVVGLLQAAAAGPEEVKQHLQRAIATIWRFREKRRKRSAPRNRKKPASGYKRSGKR